jgi:putative membrane protein
VNAPEEQLSTPLILRSALGGVLMGLANLVPGISGGTMLLAVGVYPRFIDAVARVTRLRFTLTPVTLLGVVVLSAMLAIVLLAGSVKDLVVERRWVMYSLFIGLTLGGLPVVWRMARRFDRPVIVGTLGGFVGMAALAIAQTQGASTAASEGGFVLLFVAGLAGASAMILPGVSGGYLLLVIGAYVPILSGIDAFRAGVSAGDYAVVMQTVVGVLLPVGLGVVVGVAAVSNFLRIALKRFEKLTLGVLIGLLLGAVVGLWPFRAPVEPIPGDVYRGQMLNTAMIVELEVEDWPTRPFDPSAAQAGAALAFILVGFGVTTLVDRVGRISDRD